MMRFLQAIPAIFMICLAVGVMLGTTGLAFWDGFTPGARFFPGWLAGAAVLLSATLLLTQWRGTDAGTPDLPDATGARQVLATVVGLIALALLVPTLGMVPAAGLFMAYLLLGVLRAPLLPSLLTTAIVVIGIEGVFVRWLGVPLPAPFFQ
jgi:Tripartite tricarboxylate transporter TctB family